jgi:hypothetical protein
MSVIYRTMPDRNILAGHPCSAAFLVFARLQADGIIPYIEPAMLHKRMCAGLQIQPVPIL